MIVSSCYIRGGGSNPFGASFHYFTSKYYEQSGNEPVYYKKTATYEQERQDETHYSWFNIETISDTVRVLKPLQLHYAPSIVKIDSIKIDSLEISVNSTFHVNHEDNDLVGYRGFISTHSRGWDYANFYGSEEAEKYWNNPEGWKPEMFDAFHQLPPSDVNR